MAELIDRKITLHPTDLIIVQIKEKVLAEQGQPVLQECFQI